MYSCLSTLSNLGHFVSAAMTSPNDHKNESSANFDNGGGEGATMQSGEATRGLALTEAIANEISNRRITQREAANILGISDSYFNVLMSNKRWWGTVDQHRLMAIADFLDVPPITVFSLAEIVKSSYYFRPTTIANQIERALERLKSDPSMAMALPAESSWESCPADIKLFVAILYNQIAKEELLDLQAKLITIRVKDTETKTAE